MRKPFPLIVILAVFLFALMWGYGVFVAPYSAGGWRSMGPGMISGPGPWGGFSSGMMHGYMFGPGEGPGWNAGWRDLHLSIDNVRTNMERWLASQGNPRLKLGNVKDQDADTIVADIVTKDDSLVQRFVINRHNGYFRSSEN
jgi:hypothetical protein